MNHLLMCFVTCSRINRTPAAPLCVPLRATAAKSELTRARGLNFKPASELGAGGLGDRSAASGQLEAAPRAALPSESAMVQHMGEWQTWPQAGLPLSGGRQGAQGKPPRWIIQATAHAQCQVQYAQLRVTVSERPRACRNRSK